MLYLLFANGIFGENIHVTTGGTIGEMERRAAIEPTIVASYREFAPHPALAARVRALFSFTARAEPIRAGRRVTLEIRVAPGDPYRAPMFADGNSSVVFDFGTDFRSDDTCRDGLPVSGHVIGPTGKVTADVRHELPAMVGAYFHPAQISRFVRVPSGELRDRLVAIENLWGAASLELCERLSVTQSEGRRLDLLEHALLQQMSDDREMGTAVDVTGLATWVLQHGGRVTIESLASAAGVSRQHLTRAFRYRVGVSPKLYCRLARFQSALAYARAGDRVDWARVACDLGYADQSHMISEFREFSSLTPHMLATGRWYHPFIERAKARANSPALRMSTREARLDEEPLEWDDLL
jgi:AraC-like DNA-binding protein